MHAQVTPEDSRLLHSIPPARVALIERIALAAPGAGKSAKAQNNLQQRFVRSYFRRSPARRIWLNEPRRSSRKQRWIILPSAWSASLPDSL